MTFLSHVRSRTAKAAVLAAAVAATTLGASAPASATSESQPNGCPPDPGYAFNNAQDATMDMVPPAYAQGGQSVTITVTAGTSVTATVGGSVSGDASVIVASAQAQVSSSIAWQLSASVAYSSTWTVPGNVQWGILHAGAYAKRMNWEYGSYNGACKYTVWRSGTATAPIRLPAFWHDPS
jgi:hypothetical protein